MQNSQQCMFCRYRKARIAACCGADRAAPAQQEGGRPAQAASPAQHKVERPVREPSRQEAPDFA